MPCLTQHIYMLGWILAFQGFQDRRLVRMDTIDQHADSETKALADIVKWSRLLPGWQRDALRRICTNGTLNEQDFGELAEICVGEGANPVPLTMEHIRDPEASSSLVILDAICDPKNVNALNEDARLTFGKSGLTVVYGENGSGKSGYVRILKKTCRARVTGEDDDIHPNIYADGNKSQSAVIKYRVNHQKYTTKWDPSEKSDPRLTSVSVFDGRTANVHVDNANDVAYKPFPMLILERLADACKEIRNRIEHEIAALQQAPSAIAGQQFSDGTAVQKVIAALSWETSVQHLLELAALDEDDQARLNVLRADYGDDPERLAKRLETQLDCLRNLNAKFQSLQRAVSDNQVQQLESLQRNYENARSAASIAANKLFEGDPLNGIGSEAWRELWEAARRYSTEHAYSVDSFPYTDDGSRCVLCQQLLSGDAADRLTRFETFVKDEMTRRREQAAVALREALDEMTRIGIAEQEIQDATTVIRDQLGNKKLAELVRGAADGMARRADALRRKFAEGNDAVHLPRASAWPADAVTENCHKLSSRISALQAPEYSEKRSRLHDEYLELADRELLGAIKESVLLEIERLNKRHVLELAKNKTKTNRITSKSNDIAKRLVTETLCKRFSQEIQKIKLTNLDVEMREEKPKYGVPQFKVRLTKDQKIGVGGILSEGEHRCVALAAFLTELATGGSRSAIVLDDPVSSLDHRYRESVAERLVEEAVNRQVVVFTHDLTFFVLLQDTCRRIKANPTIRWVARTEDSSGNVQPNSPMQAQPVCDVIESIQKRLDNEKYNYKCGRSLEWERSTEGMYLDLRRTWERAVEDALKPVLSRFSNKIHFSGVARVAALEPSDCTIIQQANQRISPRMHSSGDAKNIGSVSPEEIQFEIDLLRKWVEDIEKRQKHAKCTCN